MMLRAIRNQIRFWALLWILLAVALPVFADTGTSKGDRSGEGSTPFTGLASAPDANLFTGSAGTAIKIEVPPGRRNATPNLALSYSSAGGPGPYGFGWDLPIGRIERSTKRGVPRCSPEHDDFILQMPGGTIELQKVPSTTDEYRPKVEDAYLLAKKFPAPNKWEVYDRAGNTFVFGSYGTSDPSARSWTGNGFFMQQAAGVCNYVGAWALTRYHRPEWQSD